MLEKVLTRLSDCPVCLTRPLVELSTVICEFDNAQRLPFYLRLVVLISSNILNTSLETYLCRADTGTTTEVASARRETGHVKYVLRISNRIKTLEFILINLWVSFFFKPNFSLSALPFCPTACGPARIDDVFTAPRPQQDELGDSMIDVSRNLT
jgi:hypothetical protein